MEEPSGDDDASVDGPYEGGTSVIPTYGEDGSYGEQNASGDPPVSSESPDSAPTVPCPRTAAEVADAGSDAGESFDTGGGDPGVPDDASDGSLGPVAEGGGEDVGAACPGRLGPGDLVIDELMIASQAGSGDHGEWVEVASTRTCALSLKGLFAEVPHGKGMTLASITTDVWLPPHGFFLIADSANPADNHSLPGVIVTWGTGTSAEILKNSGDTITLYTATAIVDALTYPMSAKLVDGASMAFPSDCDPSLRVAFGNWQPSLASWTPGFFGTPAAPNTDVSCAVQAPRPSPPASSSSSSSPCGG
jgi:hypothetical protein